MTEGGVCRPSKGALSVARRKKAGQPFRVASRQRETISRGFNLPAVSRALRHREKEQELDGD
jgi:hypothetical protein